jgi:segregation and condensation protein A
VATIPEGPGFATLGADGEPGLVVDLDVYEGPLDVLLALAREQKVDITRISILRLADQYLAFIAAARRISLEMAADYLVMAAWLAYLKSRLLLPEPEDEEGLTGEEMAEALTYRLRRLEAVREVGAKLMALPRLGLDVFPRGAPEPIQIVRNPVYELSLFDLLKAYGAQRRRVQASSYTVAPLQLYALEDALARIQSMLGRTPDWQSLSSFLPPAVAAGPLRRSAVSAMLLVGLEMTRTGEAELRQNFAFGPIYLRRPGRKAS